MEKQGVMKEIRLDIQSELTMNIVNYLLVEENYIYVGNEKEIWLENLSHPTVQLIYINQRSLFNEMQASQLMKQIDRVRSRVRRRYLLWRLNVVILNIDTASCQYFSNVKDYVKIIDIQRADDFTQNEDIKQFYSSIERASLERSMSELIIEMQQTSKAKALNVRKMLEFQSKSFVIIGFLALLVILFLMIQIQPVKNIGTAIEFGAKYNPLIIAGEYWRLLTPSLIHLQLFHL
ncbi:rhomboid family intramembrane serine protease, partial [Turicibacter sanguinis]|nr:rhomboid family intramembrane serine protease [Turicibacter sanguinis]